MKTINNMLLCYADVDQKRTINFAGITNFYIASHFDWNKRQGNADIGIVAVLPEPNPIGFKIGDVVICHFHLTNRPVTIEGDTMYLIEQDRVFCIVRGEEIIPLNNFILTSKCMIPPIISPGGILLTIEEKEEANTSIIEHTFNGCEFKKGTKVVTSRDSHYPITILDKDYYRIRITDIIGYEKLD